jgi:Ca2+-binding RTX toxin-like protein
LPPEVSLERSAGDETDWMLRVTKTDSGSGQILTASVTLAGTATLVEADLLGQLTSPDAHAWVTYSETLDLAGSDPEASDPGYGIDLGLIVGDTTGYANSFFGALDYGDEYDQISGALGVIADAKFESALIARFTNQTQEIDQQSMDLSAYAGLSGSIGDDVLIGLDQDSVLYGGDDGSDRIIGGLGDDILIASGGNDTDDTFDELTGGAGADVFAFVNPGTVDAGLQNVHDVLVNDFNRGEGDRILLVGYDDLNDVLIHDVYTSTNTQRVSLEDGLSVMFDLSFSREFDSNFALRLADFDKFEG